MTNQPHTAIVTCHNHLADKYNENNIGVFSPNICYKYSIQLTKIDVEIIRSVGNTNSSNWSERVACGAMGNNLLEVMNLKPGKLGKGYIFKKNKTVRNIHLCFHKSFKLSDWYSSSTLFHFILIQFTPTFWMISFKNFFTKSFLLIIFLFVTTFSLFLSSCCEISTSNQFVWINMDHMILFSFALRDFV